MLNIHQSASVKSKLGSQVVGSEFKSNASLNQGERIKVPKIYKKSIYEQIIYGMDLLV